MSIITKTIAKAVATKLVEKQSQKVQDLKIELGNYFTNEYQNTLPRVVLEGFKNHPNFFNTCKSFSMTGHGFNWETITANKSLPCTSSSKTFDETVLRELRKKYDAVKDAKKLVETLIFEIETALLNLKTYSKINANFPEATPFLPIKTDTALMVNVDNIRNKLK